MLSSLKIRVASGFTMIELIVVISLIGILGVYAQSRFDRTAFDERYFADDAKSAMRFAHKYALASGCATQFNMTATGFNLKTETAAECVTAEVTDFSKDILRPWQGGAYVNLAPKPASLTLSVQSVVFYPQGWADCADTTASGESTSTVVFTLTGASSTRTINVVCSTGFVHQS